jgi:tetratricopeptide (TPR) repeat protein
LRARRFQRAFGGFAAAAVLSALGVSTTHAGKVPFSSAENACTDSEKWTFGSGSSKWVGERIKGVPSGREDAIMSYIAAWKVNATKASPESVALGQYFMGRAYFELGLMHLADAAFSDVLGVKPDPSSTGVKLAALSCLNQIHRKYPSLGVFYNSGWSIGNIDTRSLSDSQRESLWQGMALVADRKLFISGRNAQLQYELNLLNGSGPYEASVRAKQSMIMERDLATVADAERFLKTPKLPDFLKPQEDGARINLARTYYQQQHFEQAIAEFKKVRPGSRYLAQALNDEAWAQMMLKKFSDAASSAYNLLVGSFKKTFAPEAPVIIAMALYENCHYKEAQETVTSFKKTYGRSYRWLYDWYGNNKKSPVSLYPSIVKYLQGEKGVPEAIASEWIRSPVFIAEQQELNLSFEEEKAVTEILSTGEESSKEQKKYWPALSKPLKEFSEKLPDTRKAVIAKIDAELTARNNSMLTELSESYETAQLIEVEVMNKAGEAMVRQGHGGKTAVGDNSEAAPKSDDSGPPALDWGRYPSSDGEESEDWDDELGGLKTDVTSICKKAK